MSNASTGAATAVAVTILVELDPMIVYRKARQLICRHPVATPVITEIVGSYDKLLSDLRDDYALLESARP